MWLLETQGGNMKPTRTTAMQCVLLAAALICSTRARALVLFQEPLTDGKTGAVRGGGRFESEGWKALSDADNLRYVLPEDQLAGSMQYECKGFRIGEGRDRWHVWGLYDVHRVPQLMKGPESKNGTGFTLRIVSRMYKHGVHHQKTDYPGQVMFRIGGLHGNKYARKSPLSKTRYEWDPERWYRFRITWTQTEATFFRDGEEVLTLKYPDKKTNFRHLYLNTDNHGNFKGARDIVYRNVIVTDDPHFTGDTTPPSAPSRLRATPEGLAEIALVWRAAADAQTGVRGYKVYRNGVQVGATPKTRFRDTGLTRATRYTYTVSAINGWDLEGPQSARLSAKTGVDPQAVAASRTPLVALIQRGIAAGRRKSTSIAFGARTHTVRLLSADEAALHVDFQGNAMPLSWRQFSSRQLYRLARPCASTPADHELLSRFCREAGFAREAAGEARLARARTTKGRRP